MLFRKPARAVAAVLLTLTTGLAHADTGTLQAQVDAIDATPVVGVLASSTTGTGSHDARAGVADVSTGAPVPLDAEFRIGSVTKTFVATVVLQMVGEGRLSLDDPVARWLPGVVDGNGNDGAVITVRQLLEHTSGIPDYTDDVPALASADGFRANRWRTYLPAQLVFLATGHPPVFPPGAGASYSNTNYVVLGMIINRVTGRSWAHEVETRIIDPLDLAHTTVPGLFPFVLGPHVEGYSNFGAGGPIDVTVANQSMFDAAGSMISTAGDLTRFLTALVGGRLLAPAQLAAMETTIVAPQLAALWPGARYGLGLGWFPLSCGGGFFGHPGDVPGFHTWDAVSPHGDRALVVLVTGDGDERTLPAVNALVDHQFCGAE
jgi:D-alanyl-D-alanine carboxypeptidase